MAGELALTFNATYTKSPLTAEALYSPSAIMRDVAGLAFAKDVVSVATAETAIPHAGVATIGFVVAKNLDATNFVTVGCETGHLTTAKLLPGDFCIFRAAANALYAKADTAACNVLFFIIPA